MSYKFAPLNKNEKLHKMFLQNLYDLFIYLEVLEILLINDKFTSYN
jgi:hypothetical protein